MSTSAKHPLPPLSPDKMEDFQEFIWRAMGRLDGAQWRDLLDPCSQFGRAARAYYEELADGRPWEDMVDFLSPLGSDKLAEHLPPASNVPPIDPDDLH